RRLPNRARTLFSRALAVRAPVGTRLALAHFIAGRADDAAGALAAAKAPRRTLSRQVMAELAVQLGDPALAPGGLASARPLTRARGAWNDGDITGAIHVARGAGRAGQRYAARLASERATTATGFVLEPPTAQERTGPDGGIRAFHVLTNSVPHTASG